MIPLLFMGIDIVMLPAEVNMPSLAPGTGGMLMMLVPAAVKLRIGGMLTMLVPAAAKLMSMSFVDVLVATAVLVPFS